MKPRATLIAHPVGRPAPGLGRRRHQHYRPHAHRTGWLNDLLFAATAFALLVVAYLAVTYGS